MAKKTSLERAIAEDSTETGRPVTLSSPASRPAPVTAHLDTASAPDPKLPVLWRVLTIIGISAALWLGIAWVAALLV